MLFILLATLVLLLCCLHCVCNYNAKARLIRRIPGPKDHFIFSNAPEILVSSEELFNLGRTYANRFKGIYRFHCFPFSAVNLYNPDDIEKILSSTKYNEKSAIYDLLKPWLGDGLLLSKGSKWQQRRKILTPTFHFNILRQFRGILEENSQKLVDVLTSHNGTDPVNIVPILSEYTLSSICETAMGTQLDAKISSTGRSYKQAIYDVTKVLLYRFTRIYLIPDIIFNLTPGIKKQRKFIQKIHMFTSKVIKDRKQYVNTHGIKVNEDVNDDDDLVVYKKNKIAMLDLLISAEKDGLIDEAGIQEEIDTFMFEGHDTTASGLTFCFISLANNKKVQDKVYKELQSIFDDSSRSATMQDLTQMKYLECCIKESLRLYPPVHFISRQIAEKVELSNYTVPAGSFCHIHIFDLHRQESLFKDPQEFNPDRFLPENCIGRHPYSYIPFSAGPRNCIGQRFAMLEMKLAVSTVLRRFQLLPVTRPEDLQFVSDLVLRNNGPVYVSFVDRNL